MALSVSLNATTRLLSRGAAALHAWVQSQADVLPGVLLGAGLCFAVLTAVPRLNDRVERRANVWLEELRPAPTRFDAILLVPEVRATAPEVRRIAAQLDVIRRRQRVHGDVAVFFYAQQYMALMIASAAGLLTAGMLVQITRVGWGQAHPYVRVTFGVATAAGAYFGALPTMFRQSENISDNAALYVNYTNLEHEVLSYLATGEDTQGQPQTPRAFVHTLDKRLSALHRIAVGFDGSKLPNTQDALKVLPQ